MLLLMGKHVLDAIFINNKLFRNLKLAVKKSVKDIPHLDILSCEGTTDVDADLVSKPIDKYMLF